MQRDNEFVVWMLAETAHEWIEWVKVGSAISLEEAQKIGELCGSRCWGIRKNTEQAPRYVLGDDERWIGI